MLAALSDKPRSRELCLKLSETILHNMTYFIRLEVWCSIQHIVFVLAVVTHISCALPRLSSVKATTRLMACLVHLHAARPNLHCNSNIRRWLMMLITAVSVLLSISTLICLFNEWGWMSEIGLHSGGPYVCSMGGDGLQRRAAAYKLLIQPPAFDGSPPLQCPSAAWNVSTSGE